MIPISQAIIAVERGHGSADSTQPVKSPRSSLIKSDFSTSSGPGSILTEAENPR